MNNPIPGCGSRRRKPTGVAQSVLLPAFLVFPTQLLAETSGFNSPTLSTLEGKTFVGELGRPGKSASSKDRLRFKNGLFISEECQKRCGYTAGEYWMRQEGGKIEVKAKTDCLESDATIVWQGKVNGDKIEGKFIWTNKRWYWTFQKEFWFKGKLVESDHDTDDQ